MAPFITGNVDSRQYHLTGLENRASYSYYKALRERMQQEEKYGNIAKTTLLYKRNIFIMFLWIRMEATEAMSSAPMSRVAFCFAKQGGHNE